MIIEQIRPKNGAGIFGTVREKFSFKTCLLKTGSVYNLPSSKTQKTCFLFPTFLPKYLLENILKTTAPRSHCSAFCPRLATNSLFSK
jgi:hypothetical protein